MNKVPYNEAAELSLIAGVLMWPSETADMAQGVAPEDLYSPFARNIWTIFLDLYCAKGQKIDFVAIRDELTRLGLPFDPSELMSILTSHTKPTPHTVKIILRDSWARQFLGAMTQATQDVYQGGDPYDISDQIQRFTRDRSFSGLPEALTIEELEAQFETATPWVVPGILRQDWRILVVAGEGGSKALDVSTPIATPRGWTTMGNLKTGDRVFDEKGAICVVIGHTEVIENNNCYLVTFSDGSEIVADEGHLWVTVPYKNRQQGKWEYQTVTTAEMSQNLMARSGHTKNYAIDTCGPLEYPAKDLLIDPYVLGIWLGDGTSASGQLTTADIEVVEEIRRAGYEVWDKSTPSRPYAWSIHNDRRINEAIEAGVNLVKDGKTASVAARMVGASISKVRQHCRESGVTLPENPGRPRIENAVPPVLTFHGQLRALGVLNNKHIPIDYLHASVEQRLALLQGLMDSDGSVDAKAADVGRGYGSPVCSFTSISEKLAYGTYELILSMGFKATIKKHDAKLYGVKISDSWRILWQTDMPVFRLPRKLSRLTPLKTRRSQVRYVKSVDPIESRPVKCIQVSAPSGCFLAGRNLIPTHNSVTLRSILMCAAQGFHAFNHKPIDPQRVLSVDLENPRDAVLETGSPLKRHLMRMAGDTYDPTRYRVWKRLQGINIRKRADRAELTREIENQKPSIVAIGPWNKMGRKVKGEDHEDMAADMLAILDDLRIKYEFALMIEHHAPKGQHGSQRVLDPFGSQRLMAWPEIGISLRADPDAPKDSGVIRVERHRGDRMKNGWPEWILRDPDWMVQGKWPLEQEVREKLGSHTGGY